MTSTHQLLLVGGGGELVRGANILYAGARGVAAYGTRGVAAYGGWGRIFCAHATRAWRCASPFALCASFGGSRAWHGTQAGTCRIRHLILFIRILQIPWQHRYPPKLQGTAYLRLPQAPSGTLRYTTACFGGFVMPHTLSRPPFPCNSRGDAGRSEVEDGSHYATACPQPAAAA